MVTKPKKKRAIPRPEFFITTIPVIRTCRACGVVLAAGLVDGLHVTVDLVALDVVQSTLALLARVRLFDLTRTGMVHLDHMRLQDPRFSGRFPEHRCNTRWESRLPGAGTPHRLPRNATPPF